MGWEDFSKNCQFVVGLGNRVRFWQDGWYGDQHFQLAFPRLYGIAVDKEVFVEEFGMFVLLEILVIGSWMKGCIFFVY